MSDNLTIYNSVRAVPPEAKKEIQAGRLKGKTDINPMWRIKALTEQFGPCGIGWKYVTKEKQLQNGGNGEVAAFVDIDLYFKDNGEWSEPIPGTGGSMFVANESKGLYTSDECFKMALTDAISVACKALGFGADVYWDKDSTKYTNPMQKADESIQKVKELNQNKQTNVPDSSKKGAENPAGGQLDTDVPNKGFKKALNTMGDLVCSNEECFKPITKDEHEYSLKHCGKSLCRACQKKAKSS